MVAWVHDELRELRAHPQALTRGKLNDVVARLVHCSPATVALIVTEARRPGTDEDAAHASLEAANQQPACATIPQPQDVIPLARAFIHHKNTQKPRQRVTLADICEHVRSELDVSITKSRMSGWLHAAGFAFGAVPTKAARYIEGEMHAVVERRALYLQRVLALRGEDGLPLRPLVSVDESFCRVRPGGTYTWYDKLGQERIASAQEDGRLAVMIGAAAFHSHYGRLRGEWVPDSVKVWDAESKPKWAQCAAAGPIGVDVSAAAAAMELDACEEDDATRAGGPELSAGTADAVLAFAPCLAVLGQSALHPAASTADDVRLHEEPVSVGAAADADGVPGEVAIAEYGGHMTAKVFEAWFRRVCDSARTHFGPSTFIMDNAKVHLRKINPAPTTRWLKAAILQYCADNGIAVDPGATKKQLLEAARAAEIPVRNVVVEIAAEYDHEVLFLPPYHPELNHVEGIWMVAKKDVQGRQPGTMSALVQEARAALTERLSYAAWRHAYARVVAWEDKYVAEQEAPIQS